MNYVFVRKYADNTIKVQKCVYYCKYILLTNDKNLI